MARHPTVTLPFRPSAVIRGAVQSVNEKILDQSIKHAVFLEGLKTGEVNKIIKFLNNDVLPDYVTQLRARLDKIDIKGFDLGPVTTRRLKERLAGTNEFLSAGIRKAGGTLRRDLESIAISEAEWARRVLAGHLGPLGVDTLLPSTALLRSVVSARPFQGALLKDWVKGWERATLQGIDRQIKIGLVAGEGTQQIVRRVIGSPGAAGVFQGLRRNATAIVRTSVNHTTTHAREVTFQENRDVVKGVQWVSTLDGRTTFICMGLDGRIFRVDSGQRPPAHINCRSTTVPVLRSLEELGLTNAQKIKIPEGTRASMNGQVPAKVRYGDFLKRIDKTDPAFVTRTLGPGRAKLWREGKVHITRFTDQNLKPITLKELRQLEGLDKPAPKLPGEIGPRKPRRPPGGGPTPLPPPPKPPKPKLPDKPAPDIPAPTVKKHIDDVKFPEFASQGVYQSPLKETRLRTGGPGSIFKVGATEDHAHTLQRYLRLNVEASNIEIKNVIGFGDDVAQVSLNTAVRNILTGSPTLDVAAPVGVRIGKKIHLMDVRGNSVVSAMKLVGKRNVRIHVMDFDAPEFVPYKKALLRVNQGSDRPAFRGRGYQKGAPTLTLRAIIEEILEPQIRGRELPYTPADLAVEILERVKAASLSSEQLAVLASPQLGSGLRVVLDVSAGLRSGKEVADEISKLIGDSDVGLTGKLNRAKRLREEIGKLIPGSERWKGLQKRIERLNKEIRTTPTLDKIIREVLELPEDRRLKVVIDRTEVDKLPRHFGDVVDSVIDEGDFRTRLDKSQEFVQRIVNKDVFPDGTLKIGAKVIDSTDVQRSFHRGSQINMERSAPVKIFVHEIGHAVEQSSVKNRIIESARKFLKHRWKVGGKKMRKLSEITGSKHFDSWEVANEDKFQRPYMGKDYGERATELVSMGLEELHFNPGKFLRDDREYFEWIVDVIRGRVPVIP